MKVSGQLEESSLELLATDPTNLPEGRVWENTTSKDFKAVLNGIVRKVLTEISVLTTSNYADSSVTTAKIADSNITTVKIADANVTTSKIADSNVTTSKIATGAITPEKKSALGQQLSGSSGTFSTALTTMVDVTNLSVTITTTGRPVFVGLISDGSVGMSYISARDSSGGTNTGAQFAFLRGSTEIARHSLYIVSLGGSGILDVLLPSSSLFHIDTPAAGTHTYKLQARNEYSSRETVVRYAKLVAYEL